MPVFRVKLVLLWPAGARAEKISVVVYDSIAAM